MSYKQSILVILCLSLTLGQAQKKQNKTTVKSPFRSQKKENHSKVFLISITMTPVERSI